MCDSKAWERELEQTEGTPMLHVTWVTSSRAREEKQQLEQVEQVFNELEGCLWRGDAWPC